jgi:hypothetical protein
MPFNLPGVNGPSGVGSPAGSVFAGAQGTAEDLSDFERTGRVSPTQADQYLDEVIDDHMRALEQAEMMRQAYIRQGQLEVAAQFDPVISELKKRIDDAVKAKGAVSGSFDDRAEVVNPYFQAAIDEVLPTGESIQEIQANAAANVDEAFNVASEGMASAVAKISEGDADLASAISQELVEFEGLIESGLEESLDNETALVIQGGVVAHKLAEAAYAQDVLLMDTEQKKIQAELDAAIDDMKTQLQKQQEARARAMRSVRDSAPGLDFDFDLNPLDAFQGAWSKMAEEMGWTFEQANDIYNEWEFLYNDGKRTTADAREYYADEVYGMNLETLSGLTGISTGKLADELGPSQMAALASGNHGALNGWLQTFLPESAAAAIVDGIQGADWAKMSDYSDQIQAFKLWEDHAKSWERDNNALRRQYLEVLSDPRVARSFTKQGLIKAGGGVRRDDGKMAVFLPVAAQAMRRMLGDMRAAGIGGVKFSGTYRSWEAQMKYWQEYQSTGKGAPIAHPDNSKHPKGLAADFNLGSNKGILKWLRANAHRYGWKETVKGEPWHWEFRL